MKRLNARTGFISIAGAAALLVAGGLLGYAAHDDAPVTNIYQATPPPSPTRVPFSDMTERYESLTTADSRVLDAVRELRAHPVPNPRTAIVPKWEWVTVLAYSNDNPVDPSNSTCGIDVGASLTEIGVVGDQVLVIYEPPTHLRTAGTPCDGKEIFLLDDK